MALDVMSYSEASRLLSALRNVKRHIAYFNQFKIDLPMFEEYLDCCIHDMELYKRYMKNEC